MPHAELVTALAEVLRGALWAGMGAGGGEEPSHLVRMIEQPQ